MSRAGPSAHCASARRSSVDGPSAWSPPGKLGVRRKFNLRDTFPPPPAAYDQRIYGEPEDHVAIPDQDTLRDVPEGAIVREGEYGSKVIAVEPGGAEFIPLHERHGSPLQLFWTWVSPNMEFATIFVGVLGVAAFGLSFWESFLAIVLGTALGG